MDFRLSGSDLTVSFAAIGSEDSSLGSNGGSSGGSDDDDEAELLVVFWWLCCRCVVRIAVVMNAVRRGGAALVYVVMEAMCWFDAAVECAVQYVWAGCGMASLKWCSVRSFVASVAGLCGFATTIVSTPFSGVVMALECGDGSAFQESSVGAVLSAGPCANVIAQASQECEPDTIVSGNVSASEHIEPDTCVSGGKQMHLGETAANGVTQQEASGLEQHAANGVGQQAANGIRQQAANGVRQHAANGVGQQAANGIRQQMV